MHLLITDLIIVKARKDFYRILYINAFLKIMDYNFTFVFSFSDTFFFKKTLLNIIKNHIL